MDLKVSSEILEYVSTNVQQRCNVQFQGHYLRHRHRSRATKNQQAFRASRVGCILRQTHFGRLLRRRLKGRIVTVLVRIEKGILLLMILTLHGIISSRIYPSNISSSAALSLRSILWLLFTMLREW
jgi:hypothetical protein